MAPPASPARPNLALEKDHSPSIDCSRGHFIPSPFVVRIDQENASRRPNGNKVRAAQVGRARVAAPVSRGLLVSGSGPQNPPDGLEELLRRNGLGERRRRAKLACNAEESPIRISGNGDDERLRLKLAQGRNGLETFDTPSLSTLLRALRRLTGLRSIGSRVRGRFSDKEFRAATPPSSDRHRSIFKC